MRRDRLFMAAAGAASVGLLAAPQLLAQSFRVGDSVEASPMMMNSHWESCTVLKLLAQGDVLVACGPRKTEYVVQGKWVRPGRAGAPGAGIQPSGGQSPMPSAAADGANAAAVAAGCPNAPIGQVGHKRQEHGICRIGAKVTDRQGRTGTVIDAPAGATCRVCLADGSHRDYLTWMLSAAGTPPAAAGRAASGNYQCNGGPAGNMRITVKGGRWQNYYVETLPDGRVGISSTPNGKPYYMVCEKR